MTLPMTLAGWTILLVEDEPDNLDVLRRLLTHFGAAIRSAPNGQAGLDAALADPPRLVIADLSMPTMDGWELLKALRQHEATRRVPVIAVTAHAMLQDRQRVLAAGFDGYVAKPISPPTFLATLFQILAHRQGQGPERASAALGATTPPDRPIPGPAAPQPEGDHGHPPAPRAPAIHLGALTGAAPTGPLAPPATPATGHHAKNGGLTA